jgi:hypothetical protein
MIHFGSWQMTRIRSYCIETEFNMGGFTLSNRASNRRSFIGGSDARIIMGKDEAALLRLWREKRGEVVGGSGLREIRPARTAVLSVISGGGKWVEIKTHADPLYQHLIITAEKKFWRCVENGEPPALFGVDPPKPRVEVVRIVDMTSSNAWAEFAAIFSRTREAHVEHEQAKAELKSLVPDDAQQAFGHGIRAKRSKSGAVSFDLSDQGGAHAAL